MRKVLHWFAAIAVSTFGTVVTAQDIYPSKPIQIVVGFTPGGGGDTIARAIAPVLSAELKVPVVVENKPGASGAIATEQVARAKPDGYTLLIGTPGALTIAGSLRKIPYDPARDFTNISQLTSYPNIIVAAENAKFSSVQELLREAKQHPGRIAYGSTGNGATPHLAIAYLNMLMGTEMHHVSYKGNPQAVTDVVAGHVDIFTGDPPALLKLVEAGRLKALAVTSAKRSRLFPAIPSMGESGVPDYDVQFWHALMGPKGLPDNVVRALNGALKKFAADQQKVQRIEAVGMEVRLSTPEELSHKLAEETARWRKVIKAYKIEE